MRYLFLLLFVLVSGCGDTVAIYEMNYEVNAASEPIVPLMPDVSPEMLTAGYWIARSPDADALLMDEEEIELFNTQVAQEFHILKVAEYDDHVTGDLVKTSIQTLQNALIKQNLYINDEKLHKEDYKTLMAVAGLENIGKNVTIRFGIVVKNVSQRIIPTNEVLVRGQEGSIYFDRNQMSALECATPVAILWESAGGEWLYVRSSHTVGWVSVDSVAFCTREDVLRWEEAARFAVIVRHRAPVYLNSAMTDYYGWLTMGSRLLMDENGQLIIPTRGVEGMLAEQTAYIQPEYIHEGYVPYTSRNMLNLAFEMLNAPYGWGGMYGEQDCSAFLMKVFAASGIWLPRNSSQQGNTGMAVFTQETEVMSATQMAGFFGIPGATLVQFPGHVMLYIGSENEELYVIHAIWAFVEGEDIDLSARIPARVVVSNLNLSAGTKRGVYYDRITNIRNISLKEVSGAVQTSNK